MSKRLVQYNQLSILSKTPLNCFGAVMDGLAVGRGLAVRRRLDIGVGYRSTKGEGVSTKKCISANCNTFNFFISSDNLRRILVYWASIQTWKQEDGMQILL